MADIKTIVDHSFGYDAGPLSLIDEDTLVHACGNGLKLSSTRSTGEGFVWNQQLASNGIASYAVNPKSRLIAVAEQSAQPSITLYRHPDLEVQAEFTDGTEFEFCAVAFSRDSSRLVGLGGRTDFRVNVWDVASRERVVGVEGTAPARCTAVSFNPRDASEFCGISDKGIYFWKIEKRFDDFRLVMKTGDATVQGEARRPNIAVDGEPTAAGATGAAAASAATTDEPVEKALRLLRGDGNDAAAAASRWVAHSWTTDGHVVAANAAGLVVKFNVNTGAAVHSATIAEGTTVGALLTSRSYVVAGCSDGVVRWLQPSDLSVAKAVRLASDGSSGARYAVAHMCPSPSYERLCVGCVGGAVYMLTLDSEDEDEAAVVAAANLLGSLPERAGEVEESKEHAKCVGDFHRGPVTGLAPLPCLTANDRLFATCSLDGSLRVFDYARKTMLASTYFGGDGATALTALAVRPQLPLLALGSDDGRLRFVVVKRVSNHAAELLVMGNQLLHAGTITDVAFAPTRPLLASVSADGVLFIVDALCPDGITAAEERFAAHAFVRLPVGPAGPTGTRARRVAWRGDNEVLVGLEDGRLYSVAIPTYDGAASAAAVPQDLSSAAALRAQTPPVTCILINAPARCVHEVADTTTGALITSLASKEVALYDLDWPAGDGGGAALDLERVHQDEPTEPLGTLPLHAKGVMCAASSPHGDSFADGVVVLATGAADGSICITVMREGTVTGSSVVRLHSRGVVRVAFSPDGMYVLSAGLDGAVFVVALSSAELAPLPATVGTAGKAELEAYLLLSTAQPGGEASDSKEDGGGASTAGAGEETLMAKLAARQAAEVAAVNEAAKAGHKKELALLGYRLKDLLQKNEKVPDLEKLARDEFAVDLIGRDAVLASNAARVAGVRANLERENLNCDVISQRIKEECWDSMQVQGRALHAFASGLIVSNFPIRRRSDREASQLEKMLLLRRIELREVIEAGGAARRAWPGLLDEVPGNVDWIINAGRLAPIVDPCARKTAGDGAEGKQGAAGGGDDAGAGDGDEFDEFGGDAGAAAAPEQVDVTKLGTLELLYHPSAARSPNQKRVQIALLKELVRQVEECFNKKFLAMLDHKDSEMEKIRGKNARISEILAELKDVAADHFKPEWHPDEQPERVLEVTQDEIGFEKYITEAEKARLAEEEAARQARMADGKDDAPERALQDMMGGTLEAKDDLALLESELQRQPWMDELTEEEMTEEQKRELADFEAKAKAVLDEKAKLRKALELELKKLKTEVKDIVGHFDQRLQGLYNEYLQTIVYKYAQELYMSRLAIAVQEREDASIQEEKLLTQLDELCDVRDAAVGKHEAFMNNFDDFRRSVENMISEDKQMEKNFRNNLMNVSGSIDQDTYKTLLALFKQRNTSASVLGGRSSAQGMSSVGLRRPSLRGSRRTMSHGIGMSSNSVTSKKGGESKGKDASPAAAPVSMLDPFVDADRTRHGPSAEAKEAAAREAALRPLSLEGDCPDGFDVDEPTWHRLQELRTAKIEMELNIAKQQERLTEMERHLHALGAELDQADESIGDVENERETLLEQRAVSGSNLELLVQLKQGQDEMEAEAVVTDYSDAVLVHRKVVQDTNAGIVRLGTEKVDILTRIKDFRKDINKLLWRHKLLDARVHDAEEHYTDLHMLRVTKTLQMFIKGGDIGERQRRDLEKADAKLEHMKKAHTRTLAKYRRAAAKVAKQCRDRQKENERLAEQRKELEAAVAVRESIHRSRVQAKGGSTDPRALAQARMKAITTRRKLIDLARTQTEEIEFLRQELDRLRQSTFPSFAHASHLQTGNVDEYA